MPGRIRQAAGEAVPASGENRKYEVHAEADRLHMLHCRIPVTSACWKGLLAECIASAFFP